MKRPRVTEIQWDEPSITGAGRLGTSPMAEIVKLYQPVNDESAAHRVRSSEVLIYSPEHENELLREPWRSRGRPTAISRPCVFGRRCVCMHAAIDGRSQSGGIVLSESMSPSELVAFEERGEYPPMRRPCILCTRANVMDTYIRTRKSCSSGARPLGFIVNWYANPAGAGGYSTDSCIPFPEDGETWMGVFGKVASFLPGKLRMVQDTITRRWSIDQSLMLHDTPSQRSSGPQVIETLRVFFRDRPDIWDGDQLCVVPTRSKVEMVKTRLEQLSTAYGLSAGLKVAWAMACFHDSIQMDHPTFLMHLHDTASTLLRVASSFGSRSRVRIKKQSDGGRSAMDIVFSRAVVEGTTSRSVSESILVALETPEGEHTITHILRVALMGSLPTCVQRPSGEVRCRLASMTTSQLKELAKRIPHDTPIAGAALVEFSDFCINSGEAPGVLDLIGGAQRWTERASRAGSFLNIIRGGLSKSWGESDDLFGCITNGEISESARRVNKRSSNHQPLVAAPSKLRVLELAVKSTPSDREPSSATIVEALNATDASGLSSVPPDELSALAGLIQRIKSDASVTIISDGDSTSEPMRLLMCTTCMVLKNFAVKMTDAKSNFVTAGFRKMSAPNPLDSDPRPCCVETPACAR